MENEPTQEEVVEHTDIVVPDAGVEHGTVVVNSDQEQEKIVYDHDEDGNVVGWHKETI